MKFLDQCKIYLQSGDGGNGCVSFRREKFIEFGGPDGGNGGRGGDIVFQSVNNLNTLIDFRYKQHFKAKKGDGGSGKNRSGAKGPDLVIQLPTGTQILEEDQETLIHDFSKTGETFIILKGGDGGFGNAHFTSSTQQAPRKALPGWPGAEKWVWLRLKLIADIGLIGLPNAGKSTLLSKLSKANPKIASYPFTTLHPNLGVLRQFDQELVLADLPGLCEGAHTGTGLGIRFLGHAERCAALIHLIDITDEDPVASYEIIQNELQAYGHGLTQKPCCVVLNKIDAISEEERLAKEALLRAVLPPETTQFYCISGVSGAGLSHLCTNLWAFSRSNQE